MLTFQPHISCYSWINMRQLILCLISFHAFPFWRCHHKTVGRPGQVWDICDTEYNTDNWDLYDLYDICSEWWGDLTWPDFSRFSLGFSVGFLSDFSRISLGFLWQLWQLLTTAIKTIQRDEVTWPDQKNLCDVVTFETLITIQTIENLNSWQSLLPDN